MSEEEHIPTEKTEGRVARWSKTLDERNRALKKKLEQKRERRQKEKDNNVSINPIKQVWNGTND